MSAGPPQAQREPPRGAGAQRPGASPITMWSTFRPSHKTLRLWQAMVLVAVFVFWYAMTTPGLIPPVMFENDRQAAFFFGEPIKIFARIWSWFATDRDIYAHLWVTLLETVLAFASGTIGGLIIGMWLALSPVAGAIFDPYIKALNSMPRVILAPIFAVWFGLGIASKVALGFTLVFFIVFFNVYQGVKEVSPTVLANARMLGASRNQLLAACVSAQRDELGFFFAAYVGGIGVRRRGRGRVPGLFTWRRLPDPAGGRLVRYQHCDGRHSGADRIRTGARLGCRPGRNAPDEVATARGRNRKAIALVPN